MADPKHPHIGDLVIDASDVSPIDLTTEQIRGLTKTREGFHEAVVSLQRLTPAQLEVLGLNPAEINRISTLKGEFDQASELLGPAEKLAELMRETRMYKGHQVGVVLTEMANQVRHRGEKDPEAAKLLGALNDLLNYIYGPAQKGAASRKEKEEAPPADPPSVA